MTYIHELDTNLLVQMFQVIFKVAGQGAGKAQVCREGGTLGSNNGQLQGSVHGCGKDKQGWWDNQSRLSRFLLKEGRHVNAEA